MIAKTSKLTFNKDIVSTIEHHLTNNEIIERLADLHEELSHVEQENIQLESLHKYRTQLMNKRLLKNKDIGIQAFATCCISDILRIYAPDAPYTENELTEIFRAFFNQFKMLTKPDNGYYIQQVYLLTKLVEVRSIVLVTDLPQSEKLTHELFKVFYNPENNQFSSKLWSVISDLLEEVLSETENVSMDVLKLIFNKFLTYNPTSAPKGLQITQDPSFHFSLQICENSSGRLNRCLTRFYTEILYDITKPSSSGSNKDNSPDGINDDDSEVTFIDEINSVNHPGYKALVKLHLLVLRLWTYVPELVSAVSGFLYQELYSKNELFRIATTKLIGELLSTKGTSLNFASSNADIYKAWLTKIADNSAKVRISWVSTIPSVLNSDSSYINEQFCENICQGLSKTLIDTEFKVRLESVSVFKTIGIETIWTYFKNPVIFNELLHLTREKNKDIRESAINYICEFYSKTKKHNYHILISNDKLSEIYFKIPSTILNLYYINDKSINQVVDILFVEKILPFGEESNDVRVDDITELVSLLDPKAKQSFFAFNKRQIELHSVVYKFMEMAEKINSMTDVETHEFRNYKASVTLVIKWLSAGLSDAFNISTILDTFVSLNNQKLFEIMKKIVSSDTPYSQLMKLFRELKDKLKDGKLFSSVKLTSMFTRDEFASMITLLAYRSAFIVYNKSNIPVLLEKSTAVDNSNTKTTAACGDIVEHISMSIPSAFKDEILSLLSIIKTHSSEDKVLLETLKTVYRIGKVKIDYIDTNDMLLIDRLMELVENGSPYEAQYACKIILLLDNCTEHLETITSSLLPISDDVKPSQLLVLSEIFGSDHYDLLTNSSTDIVTFVLANVLLRNPTALSDVKDNEDEWIDDDDLCKPEYTDLARKVFSLSLITNNLISLSKNLKENENEKEIMISKSLKLFFFLIESGGELIVKTSDNSDTVVSTPVQYQKKLRLESGLQILKLAEQPVLNNFINSINVEKLVNLIEDESLQVRSKFLDTLKKYITDERISIKFLPLMFFVAFEPDRELKKQTKLWIQFTSSKKSFQKTTFFERGFSRFIHYIAHHPDIYENLASTDPDVSNRQTLSNAVEYILYYFENILKKENISLLFYLSNRIKQYQDIDESEPGNQNIYIISEIIQLMLVEYKELKNWDIPVYQGKLNLPTDLYLPVTDSQKQSDIINHKYLKDNQVLEIKTMLKSKSIGARVVHGGTRRSASRTAVVKKKTAPARKRKRHLVKENDDGDSDEDEYRHTKSKPLPAVVRKSSRAMHKVDYVEDSEDDNEDDEGDDI